MVLPAHRRRRNRGPSGPEQTRLEALYLGLRTRQGVDLDLLLEAPRGKISLEEMVKAGLAEVRGGRLVPTREGLVVADRLALGCVD